MFAYPIENIEETKGRANRNQSTGRQNKQLQQLPLSSAFFSYLFCQSFPFISPSFILTKILFVELAEGDFVVRRRDGVANAAGIEPLLPVRLRRGRAAPLPP